MFLNKLRFNREDILAPRKKPKARGTHLFGYPRLLFQYIHNYPPYCRPILHPQPVNATCRGYRDPIVTELILELCAN